MSLSEEISHIKYEISQLTQKVKSLEYTVTDGLERIEKAIVACAVGYQDCKKGYEDCKKGYEDCREGYEACSEIIDDLPSRIDCGGVATGYV